MGESLAISGSREKTGAKITLAKPLAPEEVRVGDYISILHVTYELPSFLWCEDSFALPRDQPVRLQLLSDEGGLPLKVCSVCLPFVLVKDHAGKPRTLDVRKHRLARLHRNYAKAVWKARKKQPANPLAALFGI